MIDILDKDVTRNILDNLNAAGWYETTIDPNKSNLPSNLKGEVWWRETYNVNNLPEGRTHIEPERIVCAANQYKDHNGNDVIIAGVRHACDVMHTAFVGLNSGETIVYRETEVQGFLTNKHRFVDRQEAWKIAAERRQIICRVGGDTSRGGTLYSENLY